MVSASTAAKLVPVRASRLPGNLLDRFQLVFFGSEQRAPTRIFVLCMASVLTALNASSTLAQNPSQIAPVPVPDPIELSKLVWTTMAAIDGANRSGNYSVLRDLGAPGFQQNNDAAQLATIFAPIRSQNIDLSNTLLIAPSFIAPPAIITPGVMRLRGGFGLRPISIGFDLYYQWSNGRWKLYGVSLVPVTLASVQPVPERTPPKR